MKTAPRTAADFHATAPGSADAAAGREHAGAGGQVAPGGVDFAGELARALVPATVEDRPRHPAVGVPPTASERPESSGLRREGGPLGTTVNAPAIESEVTRSSGESPRSPTLEENDGTHRVPLLASRAAAAPAVSEQAANASEPAEVPSSREAARIVLAHPEAPAAAWSEQQPAAIAKSPSATVREPSLVAEAGATGGSIEAPVSQPEVARGADVDQAPALPVTRVKVDASPTVNESAPGAKGVEQGRVPWRSPPTPPGTVRAESPVAVDHEIERPVPHLALRTPAPAPPPSDEPRSSVVPSLRVDLAVDARREVSAPRIVSASRPDAPVPDRGASRTTPPVAATRTLVDAEAPITTAHASVRRSVQPPPSRWASHEASVGEVPAQAPPSREIPHLETRDATLVRGEWHAISRPAPRTQPRVAEASSAGERAAPVAPRMAPAGPGPTVPVPSKVAVLLMVREPSKVSALPTVPVSSKVPAAPVVRERSNVPAAPTGPVASKVPVSPAGPVSSKVSALPVPAAPAVLVPSKVPAAPMVPVPSKVPAPSAGPVSSKVSVLPVLEAPARTGVSAPHTATSMSTPALATAPATPTVAMPVSLPSLQVGDVSTGARDVVATAPPRASAVDEARRRSARAIYGWHPRATVDAPSKPELAETPSLPDAHHSTIAHVTEPSEKVRPAPLSASPVAPRTTHLPSPAASAAPGLPARSRLAPSMTRSSPNAAIVEAPTPQTAPPAPAPLLVPGAPAVKAPEKARLAAPPTIAPAALAAAMSAPAAVSAVPLKAPPRSARRESAAPATTPRSPVAHAAEQAAGTTPALAPPAAVSGAPDRNNAAQIVATTASESRLTPHRPVAPAVAESARDDAGADDGSARAPERAPSTDLPVQARPSHKAPPAVDVDNVAKSFGTPVVVDKSESSPSKPARVHAATLVGHPLTTGGVPQASVVGHRGPVAGLPVNAPADPSRGHARSDREPPSRVADASSVMRAPEPDRLMAHAAHASQSTAMPAPFDAVLAALPPPAAPLPDAQSALLAQAAEDLSLRATVMPDRAVLSIDTGHAGELSLHLRVKDGVADVRVTGSAAHTVDMRSSELRATLASEGLTLGSFQSGQPGPENNHAGERIDDDAAALPSRAGATSAASAAANDSSPAAVASRGLHVTA